MAAGWLAWADPTVAGATFAEQTAIVAEMGQIVHQRYDEVSRFVGEGGPRDPFILWLAGYYLWLGDSATMSDPLGASLRYISAWQALGGQPPCC
jgi:hypothetical protein